MAFGKNLSIAWTILKVVIVLVICFIVWTFISSMFDLFNPFNFLDNVIGFATSPLKPLGSSFGGVLGVGGNAVDSGVGLIDDGIGGIGNGIGGIGGF
jgi:hypothetical protein